MADPGHASNPNTVGDLTWDTVARRLDQGDAAILPVGAGAKQHGWHLPMRTDAIQAEWLAARLADRMPALIWPVLAYGHYPAFVDYAGGCSLSAPLFERVVRELVVALLGYGARAVLIVDTGLSTIAPIGRALSTVANPDRVVHLKVHDGSRYRECAARLAAQTYGTHADEMETSRMLALAPDLVDMTRAAAGAIRPPGPGPMQHVDSRARNFSASGAIGDPTAASAGKGRALLHAMIEDMIDALDRWHGETGL